MSRSRITITALGLLFVASNALWAYALILGDPPEIKPEYRCDNEELRAELNHEVVNRLTAAITVSAMPGATKADVIAAANDPSRIRTGCIDSSYVVVARRVGLRFDENGKLVGATTGVCIP